MKPVTGTLFIDNGAPSFIPLSSYMISQQIPPCFMKWVNSLSFISRLWGQAHDYLSRVQGMVEQLSVRNPFCCLAQPVLGHLVESDQGVPFEESETYLMNQRQGGCAYPVAYAQKSYTARTLPTCWENYKTFDEAIEDKSLSIMVRQRLKQVRALVFRTA